MTVGVDGRVSYNPGAKGGEFFTAALRVGFVPEKNPLRPFFELGGGVVSTTHSTVVDVITTQRNTSGALQLDFGLDVRLTDRLDLRAIDDGATASGSAGTGYLASGVVYHFPAAKH